MSGESISSESLAAILIDLKDKIRNGQINECDAFIEDILSGENDNGEYIDKNYISQLAERKRNTRIDNIERMLNEMTLRQINNVYKYVSDEFDEPDHESQALDAIIKLSRKGCT